MSKVTLEMIANKLYNTAMIEMDIIDRINDSIESRADELFLIECNGKYTPDMIREAINECDDSLLDVFHGISFEKTGYRFKQIIAEYWSDYYLKQAKAEWETNKAEAMRDFMRTKYGF